MNIITANLAKRSGAAILDFFVALLVMFGFITYAVAPIYNNLYGTIALQTEYLKIQTDSFLFSENAETGAVNYLAVENYDEGIYQYYSEFKNGMAYDEVTVFVFSNEWYNTEILNIGSTEQGVTNYFEYAQVAGVDDPSLPGVAIQSFTQAELDTFYTAAYQAAQADLATYSTYLELGKLIAKYSLQILLITGSLSMLIFYFLLPLLFGNGQTVGKKLLGIGVVTTTGLKIKLWQLLLRFVGLLAEFVLSFYTVMGAILISYTMMIFTKDNRSGHDFMSMTKACDLKKSLVFKTKEETDEYSAKVAQDEAAANLRMQASLRFKDHELDEKPEIKEEEKKG